MSKALFTAGAVALLGLSTTAQAADVRVTVSSISCTLDPADLPPATPSIGGGVAAAASNKFALAYNNFLPLAQKGDTEAERHLGNLMMRCGRPEDRAQGVTWLGKAADAGDTEAAYALGTIYMNGTTVAQDDDKAFAFVSRAAEAGKMEAQGTLGYLYSAGRGTPKDSYQAVVWTAKAAAQGGLVSLYNIARDYSEGTGLPQDDAKAAYYVLIAYRRTPKNQVNNFAVLLNKVSGKLSKSDLEDANRHALRWEAGKDALSDVLDDARKAQKQNGKG
jgi:TPR repeat protein